MRGFFWGFPGYKDQSALSFLKGRSSRFFNSPLFVQSCRGKFLYLVSVWSSFLFSSGIIRLLDFLIFFGYYLEYCLFCGEGSFSFVLRYFCKRCVFIYLLYLFLALFTFGVLGPWEFLWRAGSYISCVGLRCVECRAGTIYLSASLEWMAGLYRFSLFFCFVAVGAVRLKWWGAVIWLSFYFL